MNQKLLIVGDCHCASSTLKDVEHAFKYITKVLKQEKINVLCFAGDIFDLHSNIKSEPYNFFIRHLRKWLNRFSELEIVLAVGNHDFINNSIYCTDQHFLNPFKEWQRVKVIDYPQEYLIGSNRIAIFPYIPEGRYFEAHQEFLEGSFDFKLFISHQTFRGGRMDNGIPSETSDIWAPNYPLQISGHLHTPHTVANNLEYIGSLIHCKHSEEGKKRLIMIEFNNGEPEMIDIELEPLEVYETIVFNIAFDDIKKIKQGNKIRYVLTGGTMGELLTFTMQHKNIFKGKVKYEALEQKKTVNLLDDDSDPISELRQLIGSEVIDLPQVAQGQYILSPPNNKLTLLIENYIQVNNQKLRIKPGLTALRGDNGVGKTTTLNAVQWLLYGGNSPDGKPCKIILQNGKKWVITRISKPRQLTLEIEGEIYIDEIAQSIINNTFGSKLLWSTISYLEQKKNCNFFAYSDKEKKDFLAQIFSKSSSLREVYYKLVEKEKGIQQQFILTERDYQNLIDIIGIEPEEIEPLDLTGLENIPEDEMIELKKPDLPVCSEPPPLYLDDLQEPSEPDLTYLADLEKPETPPKPELEPVYLSDLQNPIKPEVKELTPPTLPLKPTLNSIYTGDLEEPLYEELPQPDLSLWEEVKLPKYSTNEIQKKLNKAERNLQIQNENDRKLQRRQELKAQLKDTSEAEEMFRIQKELEKLHEVIAKNYSTEELKTIHKEIENQELKNLYTAKYQRKPRAKRIIELDLAFKFSDALESQCPHCETDLLALISRNQTLELVVSEGQKKAHEKLDDDERKLLLQIDFTLANPTTTLELAQLQQKKFDLLQKYTPGDYKTFLDEQAALRAELKLIKIEEVEPISSEEIEVLRQKLNQCYEYDQIQRENERKQIEREKILKQWQQEKEKKLQEWKLACEKISQMKQERYERSLQIWQMEKEQILDEWQKKNKIHQEENAKIIAEWKKSCSEIELLRKERTQQWQQRKNELLATWQRKCDDIINTWKQENLTRAAQRKTLLQEWKERCQKIATERKNRKNAWQKEKEKLIKEWQNEIDQILQNWRKENERRQKLRDEQERRQRERLKRQKEYQKRIEKIEKQNQKRSELQQQLNQQGQELANMKDAVKHCKNLETKYFNKQLEMFNVVFENVISNLFNGAVGRISPTRENKSGDTSDRITLELWIDNVKRVDLKTLSAGEKDLVSIAFQIALISITPTPFKLILMDEPLSQLHKERLHSVVEVLEEYLNQYYCLIVVHDEGVLNENEIILTRK